MHLCMIGSLRLHSAAEQKLTRPPLPRRTDDASELAFFSRSRDKSLKGCWLLDVDASASVNAEVRRGTCGNDRESFGIQLRGDDLRNSAGSGDNARLAGNFEAKLLNSSRKGHTSADAAVDDGGSRSFSALVDIVNPRFRDNKGVERVMYLEKNALKEDPGKLLRTPAASHGRFVRLNRQGIRASDSEQPGGQVLEEKQGKLHRREIVVLGGLDMSRESKNSLTSQRLLAEQTLFAVAASSWKARRRAWIRAELPGTASSHGSAVRSIHSFNPLERILDQRRLNQGRIPRPRSPSFLGIRATATARNCHGQAACLSAPLRISTSCCLPV